MVMPRRTHIREENSESTQAVKLKKYTEKEFLDTLDKSIADSKAGRVYSEKQINEMIHEQYGI